MGEIGRRERVVESRENREYVGDCGGKAKRARRAEGRAGIGGRVSKRAGVVRGRGEEGGTRVSCQKVD